mmetsp:Transcript_160263/g.282725  ORF Transcript_160263/g.282725 Transcript_160263/m.282725 type:complete len:330 (+) Transcript_160263:292-1281(+)
MVLKPVVAFFPAGPSNAATRSVTLKGRDAGRRIRALRMNDEPAAEPHLRSRRAALSSALLAGVGLALPARVEAAPRVTRQVQLSIQIGGPRIQAGTRIPLPARREEVTLGLYGDDSPSYVELFQQVCTGSVPREPELQLRGLPLSRVERGRVIEFFKPEDKKDEDVSVDGTGRVRRKIVKKEARFGNMASNGLSHNRAGLISMRQDGLANDFLVTTGADPSLDAEYVVIGEVLSGMSFIEEMDQIPTFKREAVSTIGGAAALYGLRGGLGLGVGAFFTSRTGNLVIGGVLGAGTAALAGFVGDDPFSRDQEDEQYKPLTKVVLASATLV